MIELPRVMRDIIRDLLTGQPDIELVGETSADVDLSELVHATRADVVVMGLDRAETGTGERLAELYPGLRFLGVVGDGRDAVMYELRPHCHSLGEVSPNTLLTAMRGAKGHYWSRPAGLGLR